MCMYNVAVCHHAFNKQRYYVHKYKRSCFTTFAILLQHFFLLHLFLILLLLINFLQLHLPNSSSISRSSSTFKTTSTTSYTPHLTKQNSRKFIIIHSCQNVI